MSSNFHSGIFDCDPFDFVLILPFLLCDIVYHSVCCDCPCFILLTQFIV